MFSQALDAQKIGAFCDYAFVSEQAGLYREQLQLYGKAASAILKKPVEGSWLYFLKPEIAYSPSASSPMGQAG